MIRFHARDIIRVGAGCLVFWSSVVPSIAQVDSAPSRPAETPAEDKTTPAEDNLPDKLVLENFNLGYLEGIDPAYKDKLVKGVAIRYMDYAGRGKWDRGPAATLSRLTEAGYFFSPRKYGGDEGVLIGKDGIELGMEQAREIIAGINTREREEVEQKLFEKARSRQKLLEGIKAAAANLGAAAAEPSGLPAPVAVDGTPKAAEVHEEYKEPRREVCRLPQRAYEDTFNAPEDTFGAWNQMIHNLHIFVWNHGIKQLGNMYYKITTPEFRIKVKNLIDYYQSLPSRAVNNLIQGVILLASKIDPTGWADARNGGCSGAADKFRDVVSELLRVVINFPVWSMFSETGDLAKDHVKEFLGLDLERHPADLASSVGLLLSALHLPQGPVVTIPFGPTMPSGQAAGYLAEEFLINPGLFLNIPALAPMIVEVTGEVNAAPENTSKSLFGTDRKQIERSQVADRATWYLRK